MGPILWGPGRKRSVFADCPVLVVLPWEGGKDGFHGRVLKAAAIIYYCHKMAMAESVHCRTLQHWHTASTGDIL